MPNLFQKTLNVIYEKFSKDPSKMLIATGIIGWATSSIAQVGAILFNSKISKEQKSFLIPQEVADATVNIAAYFLITLAAKKVVSKLFSTGKIAPKSVRNYLESNKASLGDKIGKLDINLDSVLKNTSVYNDYKAYKTFAEVATTVGAGIAATNIVTPIVRNNMASNMQKNYLNNTQYKSNNMKI